MEIPESFVKMWFVYELLFALWIAVPFWVLLVREEGLSWKRALKKVAIGLSIYIFGRLVFMYTMLDIIRNFSIHRS